MTDNTPYQNPNNRDPGRTERKQQIREEYKNIIVDLTPDKIPLDVLAREQKLGIIPDDDTVTVDTEKDYKYRNAVLTSRARDEDVNRGR